jgi:predicted N-formylglutamate amidohydrolase
MRTLIQPQWHLIEGYRPYKQPNGHGSTRKNTEDTLFFRLVNAGGRSSAVLVCDHAANRVPRQLGTLGLDAVQLADHIGWVPGAADVARRLSALLDAPLVLSDYSRLVINCNRPLRSAGSITEQSDGVPVPGNRGLSAEERERRVTALFRPYHDAIDRLLDGRIRRPSLLLSIHSFTPVLNGRPRPWHIGISHWRDRRLDALMLGVLAHNGDFTIGDNAPYPIDDDVDYTIPVHGEGRGLPSVMIEIRQDEIRTTTGAAAWAARLAESYRLIEAEALRILGSSFSVHSALDPNGTYLSQIVINSHGIHGRHRNYLRIFRGFRVLPWPLALKYKNDIP